MPNDHSDASLRERLGIAERAAQGPWKSDEVVGRRKDFEPSYVVKDGDGFTIVDVIPVSAYQATAAHIAASSPDVVQADIEEILRLRAENEWLRGEVESLNKQANWLVKMLSLYTEDCPLKFSWVYEEKFPIPKIDGCDGSWPDDDYFDCSNSTPEKCWREAARKAVEELNG